MAYKTRPGESQFQARQRIARAKGFASYSKYRRAPVNDRLGATRRLQTRDAAYARRSKGSENVIRTRSRQRVVTPAGTVLTSTDMRRHRALAREAEARDLPVSYTVVVRLPGFDRRRRDKRRRRGRETARRTVRFTIDPGEIDVSSVGAFTDEWREALIDALESLYAGGGGFAVETITAVA